MLASHLAVLQTHSALKYSWILKFFPHVFNGANS